MSDWTEQTQDWYEVSQLPPGDSRRRDFEKRLENMPADERAKWTDVMKETDHIYAELTNVDMPPALRENLLRLPDAPISIAPSKMASQPLWVRYAAAIFLVGSIIYGFYQYNQYQNSRPPVALNQQLSDTIAQMAVTNQSAPMQVQSGDPNVVQSALEKQNLPFNPAVLHPSAPLTLEGGGVVYYQSFPVVFTRWSGQGTHYTLYQFDPRSLGVPKRFMRTTNSTATPIRVVLWPGTNGKCTWALVLNTDKASDYFSQSYLY